MSLARKFRRNFERNLPKMEVKMTFGEVLRAFEAAVELLDAPFAQPATAVKVGQIHRTLAPLFEDVSNRHNALLLKHASRDEAGEIVYVDAEKTRVAPTPDLIAAVDAFLSDGTDVNLPVLDAQALDLGGAASLRPAVFYPLVLLFQLPARKTTVTRRDIENGFAALGPLMGESFAAGCVAPKLARMQAALLKEATPQAAKRREIAEQYAEREEDGEIKYLNAETLEYAITPPARLEIDQYEAAEVEIEIPELKAEELTLASGKGISPRRIYGLMPFLSA